jgi:hypothetical protein
MLAYFPFFEKKNKWRLMRSLYSLPVCQYIPLSFFKNEAYEITFVSLCIPLIFYFSLRPVFYQNKVRN